MSRHDRDESPDEIRDSGFHGPTESSQTRETSDAKGQGGGSGTSQDQPPRHETRPSKFRSAPQGRRTKHPELDRDRTYALRDSELKALTDIGTFRVLRLDDLVTHRYGGDPAEARRDVDNLRRQGLILRRTTHREKTVYVTLTKAAHRFLEGSRPQHSKPRQAIYHGFVKPREARHDAAIYRLYQQESARIEKAGGKVQRVILDFELKRSVNQKLAKLQSLPASEQAERKREIAEENSLPIVNGKVALPDLRLEYEGPNQEWGKVDLELVTGDYHAQAGEIKVTRRKFQRGSVFRRGKRKQKWVARYSQDVIGPRGELRRIRRAEVLGTVAEIPTRREAEQLLADRLRLFNGHDYRPSSSQTLREFVENCWLPEVLPSLKHSTKNNYQYFLRVHLYPTFGATQLRLINRDAVQNFISAKLRSRLSWRTVKSMRTAFGTIMAAAESAELIPSNPVRKTRFPRRGLMKQKAEIAPEKIRELLNALPEPSHSLAWLLVLTGLRIGELLALRWRNVDLEHGTLRVTESVYDGHFDVPKTQRSQRSLPLCAMAIRILAARKPAVTNPEALVFAAREGKPFDRHNLSRRQLKATCKKLGVGGVSWHWLRHANATLLDAVGTPLGTVQALLGHSSSEITREVYLHSIPADARKAVDKVEELLNRPKLTQVPENWGKGSSLIQ